MEMPAVMFASCLVVASRFVGTFYWWASVAVHVPRSARSLVAALLTFSGCLSLYG